MRIRHAMVMIALGAAMTGWAQDPNTLAKVSVIDGKEVYILNEPVREYEVVGSVKTGLKLTSILTRGLVNEDINDKVAQFTRKSIRKLEKKDEHFDAILYNSGKKISAIRFTSEADASSGQMARVNNYFGLYAFVMADPVNDYTVTEDVNFIVRGIPLLTYGWINNSIERDVVSFARKTNRKHEDARYIAYQTGRKMSIIAFE